jgi:hypothetical protein
MTLMCRYTFRLSKCGVEVHNYFLINEAAARREAYVVARELASKKPHEDDEYLQLIDDIGRLIWRVPI